MPRVAWALERELALVLAREDAALVGLPQLVPLIPQLWCELGVDIAEQRRESRRPDRNRTLSDGKSEGD